MKTITITDTGKATTSKLMADLKKKFEELDIQVSPPRSFADEETVEKLKYFCPIAWQLFKPDIKKFIRTLLVSEREKAFNQRDQEILEWTEYRKLDSDVFYKRILPIDLLSDLQAFINKNK